MATSVPPGSSKPKDGRPHLLHNIILLLNSLLIGVESKVGLLGKVQPSQYFAWVVTRLRPLVDWVDETVDLILTWIIDTLDMVLKMVGLKESAKKGEPYMEAFKKGEYTEGGFKELQERLNELYDSMSKETEKYIDAAKKATNDDTLIGKWTGWAQSQLNFVSTTLDGLLDTWLPLPEGKKVEPATTATHPVIQMFFTLQHIFFFPMRVSWHIFLYWRGVFVFFVDRGFAIFNFAKISGIAKAFGLDQAVLWCMSLLQAIYEDVRDFVLSFVIVQDLIEWGKSTIDAAKVKAFIYAKWAAQLVKKYALMVWDKVPPSVQTTSLEYFDKAIGLGKDLIGAQLWDRYVNLARESLRIDELFAEQPTTAKKTQ
ncbi:unnamed protein product [Vitrella brassicaformis CCMP3155]|uniref:Uncharacterized protein n=1 Tax=Vitrella brassicaformis (strain CCMP3155) TaxID=1169540 RepID=A0A0G4EML3_VITBC|nr:unnamed protein product [Vitrella brassicaformis CCMP3155]|mmetsp:Transcript_27113/g.77965  ORF Transcript_27113/g.77965 Transcript_27113/m.77965 type:complete len:370 (-) Transcript_27113:642-1751(-)|eukprot:CEL98414.1 unnamed protein product [Vitrella brassicaformis CCMP3155]